MDRRSRRSSVDSMACHSRSSSRRRGSASSPRRRCSLAWSYELLEPAERSMLGRLSVFADAFDLESALAVTEGSGPDRSELDPADLLERLVDRSLVSTIARGDATDFRLLGIIREFAA